MQDFADVQAREEARRHEEEERHKEEERSRRAAKQAKWAFAAAPTLGTGHAKSLAEIQAKEAREKQERECSQLLKDAGLAAVAHGGSGSRAGGGGGGNSLTGKIAANSVTSPALNKANPLSGGGRSPCISASGTRWVIPYCH